MPPPNITGRAHLGHGSTYTPMDVLTRYHRMLGENADWLPGQTTPRSRPKPFCSRELAKEGLTREASDASLSGARVGVAPAVRRRDQRAVPGLGFGPDWDRERFTMDAGLSAAVRKVFVTSIARGWSIAESGWSTGIRKAVDPLRCGGRPRERARPLWHVRYPRARTASEYNHRVGRGPRRHFGDIAVVECTPMTSATPHPDQARTSSLPLDRARDPGASPTTAVERELRHRRGQGDAGARRRPTTRSASATTCRCPP